MENVDVFLKRIQAGNTTGYWYRCTYGSCGRGGFNRYSMLRHMRTHLNIKPFQCQNCEYAATRKDLLLNHTRKHHQDEIPVHGTVKIEPSQ